MPHATPVTPKGPWGREDRPYPPRLRGWVVCGHTGRAPTRASDPARGRIGVVWAPARPPRAPGGRGVTPEGPWGRRAAMGGEERRKAPHIGRHRPRRGHFPARSCGVPRCLLLGTKIRLSACPPSEVTATLAAAAIRREVTPTWRPGGMCRRPNHARFGPWLGQRPRAGPGLCLTCAATYDPPAPPRWAWAVPTPPVALWGHGSGVGHANVPQGARNSLFVQIRLG